MNIGEGDEEERGNRSGRKEEKRNYRIEDRR
jgi:hypothetical protein